MGRKKVVSDERLLEAAREAFTAEGLTASTRLIARRAGVSESVLFQRYETKADLFLAAMAPPPFDLNTAAPDAGPEAPGEQVVRSLFLALLEYFRAASPVFVQLLATHDFQFERFSHAHPNNSLATLRWAVTHRLATLAAAKKIGTDPAYAALTLFAAAQGLAVFERLGAHGGRFEERMVEGTWSAMWTGLRPALQ
jgi:AcrR family transcriptional regulator